MTSVIETESLTMWYTLAAFLVFSVAIIIGALQVFQAQGIERDYKERAEKMPTLAKLQAIEASLKVKQQDATDLEARLTELRREQAEADRHSLDARHWENLAEEAKRNYELLGEKVKEIDAVKDQFEDAANNLAERRSEVDALLAERDNLTHAIESLRQSHLEAEALDVQVAHRRDELEKIREEVRQLEDKREELVRAHFEVGQLAQRKNELEQAIVSLPREIEQLTLQKGELATSVSELKDSKQELREARDETDRLTERKLGLSTDVEALEREKDRLEAELKTIVSGHVGSAGIGGGVEEDEHALDDLFRQPACLFNADREPLLVMAQTDKSELDAMGRVSAHLESLKLQFDDRLLKRFHTSLKSNRISPLTVLAGISGTGKSQLPQRYSEALGIHFLKVAVQPRWDSPQDLLGFYNYLERRYKATELARALVYLDGHTNLPVEIESLNDRMLLVLLDEMNLARVEYYFSEFLSRLEGRPRASETDEASLLSGRLEIDIPARRNAVTIYPGHNALFVGTMNEDESTQVLSDKVMDRSNILRFKRPTNLEKAANETSGRPAHRFLPFEIWTSWQREPDELSSNNISIVQEFLTALNDQLAGLQRPFGHRVNQAIFSYVANHPDYQTSIGVKSAVSDMLRMRVLPKLRGIELDGRPAAGFRGLAELIDSHLGDSELAQSVNDAANPSNATVFNWTGA